MSLELFKTVFVFGSNTEGRHGKGAALLAKKKYGAIYGQAKGLQNNSYAIITKDLSKGKRSVSLAFINEQVQELIKFASERPTWIFLVSPIGCGLAGFNTKEIAPMFDGSPKNIKLPKEFLKK